MEARRGGTLRSELPAAVGPGATFLVFLHLGGVAAPPPISAKLVPCVGPKFVPVIVTGVPAGPDVGFKLEIVTGVTVKFTLLLAKPPTATTTGPVVAPLGPDTLSPVSIHFPSFLLFDSVPSHLP